MSSPSLTSDAEWSTGAAFALTIPVDGETVVLSAGRHYASHPLPMSHQAYEIRRGVPRLLDLLADLSIPATFLMPGWTMERYPGTVAAIADAGHELAHHSYSHRNATRLGPGEQRADFERALATMDRFGVPPQGHRAADFGATIETLELVAEYGLLYDCSLMGDDRPYLVGTANGDVVELPCSWQTDDFEPYAFMPDPPFSRHIEAPHTVVSGWRSELDGMREVGGLLQLTCHAFLSGRPGRCEALAGLLEYALDCGDVDFGTCGEIARRALEDPATVRRPLQATAAERSAVR